MLKTLRALKESGDFRRRHLTFLKTLEDQDLIREIGYAQATGRPLSLSQLYMHGIASVATVQRRLARLKRLGMVEQTKADHDKRLIKLTLSPAARELFEKWGRQLERSWSATRRR
jgi:DNA-binding MarR family transcriptional regulator